MNLQTLTQINPNATTPYLILGYAVMSGLALLYVLFLWNKQRNLKQDIELLHRLLAEED